MSTAVETGTRRVDEVQRAYLNTRVTTADGLSLVLMLYDGALAALHKAEHSLEEWDISQTHNSLVSAKRVVRTLADAVVEEGEGVALARNLKSLYAYMYMRIGEANLRKDRSIVQEVIGLLRDLRAGWASIDPAQRGSDTVPGVSRERTDD